VVALLGETNETVRPHIFHPVYLLLSVESYCIVLSVARTPKQLLRCYMHRMSPTFHTLVVPATHALARRETSQVRASCIALSVLIFIPRQDR